LTEISFRQVPSVENDSSFLGFIEVILSQNIDIETLDFGDTDEARENLQFHLSQLVGEEQSKGFNLEGLLDKARELYQESRAKGEIRIDLRDSQSLKMAAQAQDAFHQGMDKMKAQPQTGSALTYVLKYSPEIEAHQFRSVDAFYRFCEDERKKEGKALSFSEHTLRKVCTKIRLNFRAL
jgi:hypothetical protein